MPPSSLDEGGKERDDSDEPVTKGELHKLIDDWDTRLEKRLETKFMDFVNHMERLLALSSQTKRLPPASPKPVDTHHDTSSSVSLRPLILRPQCQHLQLQTAKPTDEVKATIIECPSTIVERQGNSLVNSSVPCFGGSVTKLSSSINKATMVKGPQRLLKCRTIIWPKFSRFLVLRTPRYQSQIRRSKSTRQQSSSAPRRLFKCRATV